MALSKEDSLLIRDGDYVLVPVRVVRTNNHYDNSIGTKFRVESPQNLYGREEHEAPRPQFDIQSRLVHSVALLELRAKDHVQWNAAGPGAPFQPETGVIVHIDGDDITVKQDKERTPRNRVILRKALTRYNPKKEDK